MSIVCRTCMPFHRAFRQLSSKYQQSLPDIRLHAAVISSVRHCSAAASEALAPPSRDGEHKQYPQKIQQIVDQIAGLTLLEVADLNELLKKTLNIQDAPVMTAGMAMAAPAEAKQDDGEEEEAAAKQVQTSFTVKLIKFDEKSKVKLIKEIKALSENMNLVQAKKFVESIPAEVKADLGKDEAEKMKEQLEKAGGECVIE